MASTTAFWLRREASPHEQRTTLVPADAAALVSEGFDVTVESSEHRAFPIADYAAAGCRIVPGDSFFDAPPDTVVLGLKEPAEPARALTHRHVYFAHAYLGQTGAEAVLRRLTTGGGVLLDLETLVDDAGRRITAFGYLAGYMGAALAILHHRGALGAPLRAGRLAEVEELIGAPMSGVSALVTGALGRAGRGACDALARAGVAVSAWDVAETGDLDREQLLGHDILVNCVGVTAPGAPFLTKDDLDEPLRQVATVSDVTCDVTSARNRLPLNDRITTWDEPVRRLVGPPRPLHLLAIDNLPSLVPRESSERFSAELTPLLRTIDTGDDPVWARSRASFVQAITQHGDEG